MGEETEPSLIYGLELQGRSLAPITADTENISFMVGTQSLKSDNFVYIVTLDEDTGLLHKRILKYPAGEVWSLNPNPTDPNLFLSTYGEKSQDSWKKKAAVFRIPESKNNSSNDEGNLDSVDIEVQLDEITGKNEPVGAWYQPNEASKFCLIAGNSVNYLQLQESGPTKIWEAEHSVRGQTKIETGAWNPHRHCHQVSSVSGSQVMTWDTRTGDKAWTLNVASGSNIRSMDYNPNKQYYLATGGDDGSLIIWDYRAPSEPLTTVREHSHWLWSVRYNSFHDQLILSAGSDCRVQLHSQASLSSEPLRQSLEDDDVQEKILDDGIVQTFFDHEDSVYTAEWSSADPWTFASLSYDGRLVISHVPRSVKYRILNIDT
eukprot:TRINITY_DN4164_c0_g1_i6.p1 TRINITY_DN4164_c0_g1~~TRINITY_DN4164_c0_g1_i6.p1  ORF type:complete len:375 (+),score=61.29 TRINITY_DN4164_c0_g1_i6:49-1173(+)